MIESARLGTITAIDNTFPILRVQVDIPGSEEIETAVLYNAWGENSWPSIGSPVIVFILNCEFTQKYALPFNLLDAVSILAGEKIIYTATGTKIHLKQDGSINIDALNDATKPSINIAATTAVNITAPVVNVSGNIDVVGVYKVDGVQVVKEQQPAIPDPLVGLPEVHAAVDSILITLRNHGLIAS